jgi:hypothetical protein
MLHDNKFKVSPKFFDLLMRGGLPVLQSLEGLTLQVRVMEQPDYTRVGTVLSIELCDPDGEALLSFVTPRLMAGSNVKVANLENMFDIRMGKA